MKISSINIGAGFRTILFVKPPIFNLYRDVGMHLTFSAAAEERCILHFCM